MSRIENFILDHGTEESYAEPRTELHDSITFEMAEIVAKLLPDEGKILDAGCGQGPALEWFTRNGFIVTGITTNTPDMLKCVDSGYTALMCDQNDLPPMWTDSFDCVWARHVLEHSIAPFWTLHEFHRVLKTGGIFYMEAPAPDTSAHHESNVNHYSVFGWRAWLDLMTRVGFELIEARQKHLVIENIGPDAYYCFQMRKA